MRRFWYFDVSVWSGEQKLFLLGLCQNGVLAPYCRDWEPRYPPNTSKRLRFPWIPLRYPHTPPRHPTDWHLSSPQKLLIYRYLWGQCQFFIANVSNYCYNTFCPLARISVVSWSVLANILLGATTALTDQYLGESVLSHNLCGQIKFLANLYLSLFIYSHALPT